MRDKDEWGTPYELFNELDKEFNFTLDPCACWERPLKEKMKINTKQTIVPWRWYGERVFINPPYSGKNIEKWVRRADAERYKAELIVMLIPTTKTGTKWFKELILEKGVEMRFLTGRINFVPLAGQNDNSNPLYSMLLIWRGHKATASTTKRER